MDREDRLVVVLGEPPQGNGVLGDTLGPDHDLDAVVAGFEKPTGGLSYLVRAAARSLSNATDAGVEIFVCFPDRYALV